MVNSNTEKSSPCKFLEEFENKLQFLKKDYSINYRVFNKKSFITISQINSNDNNKRICIFVCLYFQVVGYSIIVFELQNQNGMLDYKKKFSIKVDGTYDYELIINDLKRVIKNQGEIVFDPNFPL